MFPIQAPTPQFKAILSDTLTHMPTEVVGVISAYTATINYDHICSSLIIFDADGHVINPEVREAYKEAIMSSYCHPDIKSKLMQRIFNPAFGGLDSPLQDELRAIFREIAASGYRVMFDGVALDYLILKQIDWRGISLIGADLSETELINVQMTDGDIRRVTLTNGEWTNVTAARSDLSDTDLNELLFVHEVDLTDALGLENWPALFTGNPSYPCSPVPDDIVAEVLDDPPVRIMDIIAAYLEEVDYSAVTQHNIVFDQHGQVTNPQVRDAYKEAFMSSYCSAQFKSVLLQNLFAPNNLSNQERFFLEQEARQIFKEIADEGHRAILDDITLRDVTLRSIKWPGASIKSAAFLDTHLIGVDMHNADARDMLVLNGEWIDVNLEAADMRGTSLDYLRVMERVRLKDTVLEAGAQ